MSAIVKFILILPNAEYLFNKLVNKQVNFFTTQYIGTRISYNIKWYFLISVLTIKLLILCD